MKPLIVLLSVFVISLVTIKIFRSNYNFTLSGRIAMAVMLCFTAMGHFMFTKGMAAMIPDFMPLKQQIVVLTGVLEVIFAIGLLLPNYRHLTAWALIVFFILLLPANIKASMENLNYQTGGHDGPGLSYLWFRIPLQLLFIVWVYLSTIKK
ncbi:DoxX family protein [Galbibacter sp. EGI 63066]|uniref:DoxX family protein n=1 Tax=Galbibacter sp. EGI 63066 TaxID=2993559 RepID=UPI0022494F77|nr:DoxX family protein [Galbibacter sp. EGI 63066]MCX2680061.1 DoxX family protein [Galbibacter sp. EGI 63066]